ncbi:serine/threonine-protein kinase SMU1-like isoform X1 [Corvus moneduloides]|uniref:serine/threonine-protein kinase SMU1-like isoform X1 n=1 Tax=Corvus moneduloides TaxID=1196302 RepID=UPI0013634C03|nr:serine/threonine-protein kinase SMU1-like isoform X1 [Corvus moneduloides]
MESLRRRHLSRFSLALRPLLPLTLPPLHSRPAPSLSPPLPARLRPRPSGRPSAVPPPPGSLRTGSGAAGSAARSGTGGTAPSFGSAWRWLRPRTRPLRQLRPEPPRCRPAPALSPAASPVRARPLVSSAAGPEPPEPGAAREAAAPGGPGQNAKSAVPPARAEKPPLEQLYRQGPLLGSGGCGSVYSGTRLADGAPVRGGAGSEGGGGRRAQPAARLDLQVAIKRVSRDRIPEWARLHSGALVPLELALLWMVSRPGFRGVVRLLDWFELPDGFALVMERPERCQDLWYFLEERAFLTEPVARGLFRQVLEAVRHCTSRGVLHRHIKAENVLVDLATGETKLIDFVCGTVLQDTFYTRMSGALLPPSPVCNREQENGKNGTGCDNSDAKNQELMSEGKGCKASLLYSSGGDMKKGSLGQPLIPPIHKAMSPPVGSAAVSISSSLQLDFQESQEMSFFCRQNLKEEVDGDHA